ncbi:hypothetical protein SO802_011262 [Lithocarpus litseifolius]|uniref:Uncharacterized protein n=1 Tax=Lithocarpus litseifolius TaxID=425828 RepID=A0AAW2D037_9ROSI
MASQMAILTRTRTLFKSPTTKSITTFTFLSQEPQLAESTHSDSPSPSPPPPPPPPPPTATPLPRNPASGSPLYNENWRSPIANPANSLSLTQSLLPLGFLAQSPNSRIQALSQTLDVESMMNVFAEWMASQR